MRKLKAKHDAAMLQLKLDLEPNEQAKKKFQKLSDEVAKIGLTLSTDDMKKWKIENEAGETEAEFFVYVGGNGGFGFREKGQEGVYMMPYYTPISMFMAMVLRHRLYA